jgi:hypothetical protein
MSDQNDTKSLCGLLDQIDEAAQENDRISIENVLHAVGRRSFGPALLVPGLIAFSPLSGVPGTPTATGIMVFLIAGQLLIGRDEFWVPGFIIRRSISKSKYEKAMKAMRPIARFVDRLTKPRLCPLTGKVAVYIIAIMCLLLALTSPLLEVLPFAISGVGATVTAFGLALISNDGVLALLAILFCVGTAVAVAIGLSS